MKTLTLILALLRDIVLLACVGCTKPPEQRAAPPAVSEWVHGFKTDYVIATRYQSPAGFSVGFRFPKHVHTYDAPEVFDWFTKYDGFAIQGGGAPGAEMLVRFKGVTDKDSANTKLAVVMPALTTFMEGRR
jgi:hypothetical protein